MLLKKISILLLLIPKFLFPIPFLDFNDDSVIFKQFKLDVNENRRRISQNKELLPMQFYKYKVKDKDSIFIVASRFNLTYDTLASLNKITNQLFFNEYKEIIIPNCLGYFDTKRTRDSEEVNIDNIKLYFTPGKQMNSMARINFLKSPFRSPLKKMEITSDFGYRENPFTGLRELHPGIDLKAKVSTKIYCPLSGKIEKKTFNDFYGNVLVIDHGYGYTTHYFHLEKVIKNIGDIIETGELVAKTGNSGRSTGPHLHFEIRKDGEVVNPVMLLGEI